MLIFVDEHHVLSGGAVFLLALPLGVFSALSIFPVGAIVGLSLAESWVVCYRIDVLTCRLDFRF
jgi:hypothetical protein